MKRLLNVLLVTALVTPLLFAGGCSCHDGYGKMRQEHGGK